jgi:hypothetical protein
MSHRSRSHDRGFSTGRMRLVTNITTFTNNGLKRPRVESDGKHSRESQRL